MTGYTEIYPYEGKHSQKHILVVCNDCNRVHWYNRHEYLTTPNVYTAHMGMQPEHLAYKPFTQLPLSL